MLSSFDLQGGYAIAAARGITVAALLSAFGTAVFSTTIAPKTFPRMAPREIDLLKRTLLMLARSSATLAFCGLCLWLLTQAAVMADADSLREAFAAVPKVLAKTSFGHVIALQISTVIVLMLVLGTRNLATRQPAALAVATLAIALQAGHSHAFSMVEGPTLLLACDILHLLGAGAWLGGLLPLLLTIRIASPQGGATAARWFSPLGQWCIAALIISAAWQAWILVATIPGLIGTAYGWMILLKCALFGVLLGFAWLNRYRFAPALLRETPEAARRILLRSITLQTACAATILAAAVVLSELPPAMHIQPSWPFAWRPSFTAIDEDPDFRWEVMQAGLALAGAAALLLAAAVLRRFRIAAAAIAGIIAWFAVPHLDLLLVPAYPTSFYHSPTGFTAASIVTGDALFAQNCAACHGAAGHGDGPMSKTLPIPPADLTAAHLWMHSDGELFWWLSHGIKTPEGAPAMPGFSDSLDEDSRWNLIDYIRAHNAGRTLGQDSHWARVIRAPAFSASCKGGQTRQLADFSGAPLLLAIGPEPSQHAGAQWVVTGPGAHPAPRLCVADDMQIDRAYGVAAGLPGSATGWVFLIDGSGLLRQAWPPDRMPGAAGLQAAIDDVRSHKVQTAMQAAAGMEMTGMDMGSMPAKMPPAPNMPGPKPDGAKAMSGKMDGMKM